MSINVLIINENTSYCDLIAKQLKRTDKNLICNQTDSFSTAFDILDKKPIDCIFLNPENAKSDPLEFYQKVQNSYENAPSLFFVTENEKTKKAILKKNIAGLNFIDQNNMTNEVIKSALNFVSSKQELLKQIEDLNFVDDITNLDNRASFKSALKSAIAHSKRTQKPFALYILDIDHFKDVNDSLGHDFGDELLKLMAEKLKKHIRETDFIARLGGDEFAIIATNLTDTDCAAVFCKKLINLLSTPFYVKEHKLYPTMSIGISLYPSDGDTSEKLLSNAEKALYKSKAKGRDTYSFYDEGMNKQALERLKIESELRTAIEENQFELYYQPKIDVHTKKIVGAEALIRWNHPIKGLIPPNVFIPIAEKNRLIVKIGLWVLETACQQIKKWHKSGLGDIPISVNLSGQQLEDVSVITKIKHCLEKTGINPKLLELEITESMLMIQVDLISYHLEQIRKMGIKVSIDDFGTGYSSLAYLKKLPVDILKIDRSFIQELQNKQDADIAKTIIGLGKSLNLTVVAEGVENKKQLDFLKKVGCDFAQGYFFAKPMPEQDFRKWYKKFMTAE